MAETNKNHAPVAASLHLDDERAKPKLMPCAHCGCADVEFDSPGGPDESSFDFVICNGCGISAGRADCDGDLHEVWNRRTPPAEVSADTLPALPGRVYYWNDLELYERADVQEYARQAVASYAEQIKKLEREGSGVITIKSHTYTADEIEGRIQQLMRDLEVSDNLVKNAGAEMQKLERELAERKQSIDTPEFRELLIEYWNCTLGGEEERTLIAYIDARPAGTAIPAGHFLVGPGTVQVNGGFEQFTKKQVSAAQRLGSLLYHAAAPSLSTGTEESK